MIGTSLLCQSLSVFWMLLRISCSFCPLDRKIHAEKHLATLRWKDSSLDWTQLLTSLGFATSSLHNSYIHEFHCVALLGCLKHCAPFKYCTVNTS